MFSALTSELMSQNYFIPCQGQQMPCDLPKLDGISMVEMINPALAINQPRDYAPCTRLGRALALRARALSLTSSAWLELPLLPPRRLHFHDEIYRVSENSPLTASTY